jgi:hypothetical protein
MTTNTTHHHDRPLSFDYSPALDHLVVLFAPDGSALERGSDVSRKLRTVPTEVFGCFCGREKRQGQHCMRGVEGERTFVQGVIGVSRTAKNESATAASPERKVSDSRFEEEVLQADHHRLQGQHRLPVFTQDISGFDDQRARGICLQAHVSFQVQVRMVDLPSTESAQTPYCRTTVPTFLVHLTFGA